jgi:hypothetical protein
MAGMSCPASVFAWATCSRSGGGDRAQPA